MEKSLLDYGFDVLNASKEPKKFLDLFNEALALSGLNPDESTKKALMSKFYTQLSLDTRFTQLDGNVWDIRSRYAFKQVHNDVVDAAYNDEGSDDYDEEERKLLREELGEEVDDEDESSEDDDLDFDKPTRDADDDEEF